MLVLHMLQIHVYACVHVHKDIGMNIMAMPEFIETHQFSVNSTNLFL